MALAYRLIRFLLAGIFVWTGVAKLRHPYEFLAAIYAYKLVAPSAGVALAAVLPWLEVVVGLCLFAGVLTVGCLRISVLLTAMFTLAMASALSRGLSINCGCFGGGDDVVTAATVARSGFLLLASLACVWYATKRAVPATGELRDSIVSEMTVRTFTSGQIT